jgi:5-formyltetrahydrofolate cyclo-ligase
MSRTQLRQQLRQQRRALDEDTREWAALELAERISGLREFNSARKIAFYLPNDGEIDPTPLMMIAWRRNKSIYLPVLGSSRNYRLYFAPYCPGDPLLPNRFGIPEPVGQSLSNGRDLDLVLTPLVGFDERGNRLGMGGGFYDRSFAFLRQRKIWRQPKLIGLAYELQRVPSLQAQCWDVPMAAIATEDRVYRPDRAISKPALIRSA